MDGALARMRVMRNVFRMLVRCLGKGLMVGIGVDERIILKRTVFRLWTGFDWLRVRFISGGLL